MIILFYNHVIASLSPVGLSRSLGRRVSTMERCQVGVGAVLEGIRGFGDTVSPEGDLPPAEYLGRSLLPHHPLLGNAFQDYLTLLLLLKPGHRQDKWGL